MWFICQKSYGIKLLWCYCIEVLKLNKTFSKRGGDVQNLNIAVPPNNLLLTTVLKKVSQMNVYKKITKRYLENKIVIWINKNKILITRWKKLLSIDPDSFQKFFHQPFFYPTLNFEQIKWRRNLVITTFNKN